MRIINLLFAALLFCPAAPLCEETAVPKKTGVLFTTEMVERAKANAARYEWVGDIKKSVIEAAQPWMGFTDDELWDMMFGNTITRSWMVWSDGYCPAWENDVPMYTWEINPLERPWKVRCPHCGELFPKNDFHSFYRSGIDGHGIFDQQRADRKLLFNEEHPGDGDPMRLFGVDDGEGYVEGDKRWRFIGAYLIYGHWKRLVLNGITNLSAAYVVTGDRVYAHKAGILLDRVADLYPTFDFGREGVVYEKPGATGYVSTWHDACEETRRLVLAYDQVFEALREDRELVDFLSAKAKQYQLENPKVSFSDIQRNIEDRILRDTLINHTKIRSNYPRTPVTLITIKTVLNWPDNRDEIYDMIDEMVEKSTAVDGVTGEKGLTAYSAYVIRGLAWFLAQFSRLDPEFLESLIERQPRLRQTWRFFIDTWINGEYYPRIGDADGWFAKKYDHYAGLEFTRNPGLDPSMYTFLKELYDITGDEEFIQVLYGANDNSLEGLPYDLFADNPVAFQKDIQDVIIHAGKDIHVGSINKQEWCLAILRAGDNANRYALWLDYDTGGRHSHVDGMNIGLYAFGLDLLPDFGYPPVQYGGWDSPRALWYRMTASHNTVVVDGANQKDASGKTTLWADGERFRAIRASASGMIDGDQYERTVAVIDISDTNFYIVDVFRVVGGTDHARFMHSHFGEISADGLSLGQAEEYGHDTQMRSFYRDPSPEPGWHIDWKIEDRYGLLPDGADIHLRYTDLTTGAEAYTAEGWVSVGGYNDSRETWIPRIITRRTSDEAPLLSTFISIIEPYEKSPAITSIRRLPIETVEGEIFPDTNIAVEITMADGRKNLVVSADVENPRGLLPSLSENKVIVQKEWEMNTDAGLCLAGLAGDGTVEWITICGGKTVECGDFVLRLKKPTDFFECRFVDGRVIVVSGDEKNIDEVTVK